MSRREGPDDFDDFTGLFEKLEAQGEYQREARADIRKALELPNSAGKLRAWVWACQAARDSGLLSPPEGFSFLAFWLNRIAEDRHEALYGREFAHVFGDDEASEEQRAAADEAFETAADRETLAVFREFGEHEMADLYEQDRVEFDRRWDEGRDQMKARRSGPQPS